MERAVARQLARALKKSVRELEKVVLIAQQKVDLAERARIAQPMGSVFVTITDELYTYLRSQDPDLHDFLFPGFPKAPTPPGHGITVKLSERLEHHLVDLMGMSRLDARVSGLIWGSNEGEPEQLLIGIYECQQLRPDEHTRIVTVNGRELVIIQIWLLDMLDGKEVDYEDGRVVTRTLRR